MSLLLPAMRGIPASFFAGIPILMPASGWDGTTSWSGRPSEPTESDTERTYGGNGWPDQPTLAPNIDDYMTIEQVGGYVLFVSVEIGHDDGFDACTLWCEGTTITQTPMLISDNPDGKAQYGLWARLKARPGAGGYARVIIVAKPRRGFERSMSVDVWLNDDGAVTRPSFWIDPVNGNNANTGTLASPWKDPLYAEKQPGIDVPARLDTGWKVIWKIASDQYRTGRGSLGLCSNVGPITHHLGAGLVPGDCIAKPEPNGTDYPQIYTEARRSEMWGIWFDTGDARSWIVPATASNSGNFIFRDGCKIYDTVGAAGPLNNGYPIGTPASLSFPTAPLKAHRYYDPDGSFTRVSAIGSAASPVQFRSTHISGLRAYIHVDAEYGWAGPFPRADARDNHHRIMNSVIKGYGNWWARNHQAITGTVTGITSQVLNGTTVWRVATDLTDLPNIPVDSNGDSTISLNSRGQHWALLFGTGIAVGGGTQFQGSFGPVYPANRDGTKDFDWLGWAIKGYETAGGVVVLNSQPVGLQVGDLIRCQNAHGNDLFFIQGGDPAFQGNLENVTIYNAVMEHPEGYWLAQQGGYGVGSGTVSYDGASTLTFSTSQSLYKGDVITLNSGGHINESAVIRKVNSATSVTLMDKINGSGLSLRPFSSTFSGASFYIGKSVVGLSFVNAFLWGTTAGAQLGSGGFTGMTWRSSTVAFTSIYAFDIFFYLDQTRRPTTFFTSFSAADSYIAGLGSDDSTPWPSLGYYARNNQYGRSGDKDTVGTGATGQGNFATSLAGTGITKTIGVEAHRVDINGAMRLVGVSKVGASTT